MSRIGAQAIQIPSAVTVLETDGIVVVSGPKGKLEINLPKEVKIEVENDRVVVKRINEQKKSKSLHGLIRSTINNMVIGVTDGWTKRLELVGVGFRTQGGGSKVTLTVGFSHPVEVEAPPGVQFEVSDNTKIKVSGIDKQLVGQIAANLRKIRPPDVYKGKGIRYEGERIRKKAGKTGKVGVVGGK